VIIEPVSSVHDNFPKPDHASKPSTFLRYIHNFRCLAILAIVAGHVIDYMHWESHSKLYVFSSVILQNGTVYFIFIAGFLFQFLSRKYEYKNYLTKKLQYVILPYILISIPAIVLCIVLKNHFMPEWFVARFPGLATWQEVAMLYLTGAHLRPFWFMPMIALFYVASPVLLWMDRHPKTYLSLPFLLALSVIVPRPYNDDDTLTAFIHFFSVYLLGMFSCHFKERIAKVMNFLWILLLAIAIVLILLETAISSEPFDTPIFINVLSKSALCFVLIYFLQRLDSRIPKALHRLMSLLADLSFGIFFLHCYFLEAYFHVASNVHFLGSDTRWVQANPLLFFMLFLFTVYICVVLIVEIRKVLGKRSRFILGC